MIVYKLRHKPSGLFFQASRYPRKSNFSKKGKIYSARPNPEKFFGKYLNVPKSLAKDMAFRQDVLINPVPLSRDNFTTPVVYSDWELVEYAIEEVKSNPVVGFSVSSPIV